MRSTSLDVPVPQLVDAIRSRDIRALARAASIIENNPQAGRLLVSQLFPFSGHAHLLGITGPAGVGKSTLVNACIRYLRHDGKRVGVIAVDPTSSVSRGALLGDRIRMNEHSADPNVFIRSAATRGQTGGIAASSLGLSILFDAAGFDFIFLETIGVGQDEVDVAALAQVTAVVLTPGSGDDVQAIKAGIMEIADIFVINKADLAGATQLADEIRFVQSLAGAMSSVPIQQTNALTDVGIDELMKALPPLFENQRLQPAPQRWMPVLLQLVRDAAVARVNNESLAHEAKLVEQRAIDPYLAADRLLRASAASEVV